MVSDNKLNDRAISEDDINDQSFGYNSQQLYRYARNDSERVSMRSEGQGYQYNPLSYYENDASMIEGDRQSNIQGDKISFINDQNKFNNHGMGMGFREELFSSL